jgi:threonine/homoserine/homoserine lactone efflux protein
MIDPLLLFVFAGLFSPGPNVIMLSASGARFGFRATLPHLLGVAFGVGITAGLTGLGIAALLLANPGLALALKIAAAVWILWMAWKLFRAGKPNAQQKDRPFTFIEAVLFQWINPKVWAVALAASSAFTSGLAPVDEAIRLGTVFSSLNLFVCLFWTWSGSLLAYLLKTPAAWVVFLRVMAVAMAGSAVLIFL